MKIRNSRPTADRLRRDLPAVVAVAALLVSLAALAVALRVSNRDVPAPAGRLLRAGHVQQYTTHNPVDFALDDFELMPLADGSFVALYSYPPERAGRVRGCTVRWEPERTTITKDFATVTGVWLEPCHGGMWDAAGRYIIGPAGRDLDRFVVTVDEDGDIWVDARTLQCVAAPCGRARPNLWQFD
jgi:hypothetical protein